MSKISVFISQPMRGRSVLDIAEERERIMRDVAAKFPDDEVIPAESLFEGYQSKPSLWLLGQSLQVLAYADIAVFAEGWELARGCRIERQCCEEYEIPTIEFQS